MSLALERTLLLWDPEDPIRLGVDPRQFEMLGMETLCVPYDRLGRDPAIMDRIKSSAAEALVFTRNDDMDGNPPIGTILAQTRMGYTTISAIDPEHQGKQTRACAADFINQKGIVDLPDLPGDTGHDRASTPRGTFTLIFDMEQAGCVRFGLPRLLALIEPLGIRATFFVTGFIASLYPGAIERLAAAGHEIAIHGTMHEFFTGKNLEDQVHRLSDHLGQMSKFSPIKGANLIYRMDPITVHAMAVTGISYFVLFRKHIFYRSRYLRPSTKPRRIRTSLSQDDLTMFPISVETYQGNFRQIKASTESAWGMALEEETRHISILLHPFKDGSLKRMNLTRELVQYLVNGLGLTSVTLSQCPAPALPPATATRILYRWHGCPRSVWSGTVSALNRCWWQPLEYHAHRTERLVDALNDSGSPAVLSGTESDETPHVTVFPEKGTGPYTVVRSDPLSFTSRTAHHVIRALGGGGNVDVRPGASLIDMASFILFHLPRTVDEFVRTLGKIVPGLRRLLRSLFKS